MSLTPSAFPSTMRATDSTFGVASSVITTASACCGPAEPLPTLIFPPCLTHVTDAGSSPARSPPPTVTSAAPPVLTSAPPAATWVTGAPLSAPLEQPTAAPAPATNTVIPTRIFFI